MSTDTNSSFKPLTRFEVGSFKEMSMLSIPLMISALSGALMFFFDRYILAHYSLEALNTAATAGMSVMVFHLGAMGIAGICEVYVGQSYGAKEYKKIGSHVWQMLWFALMSAIIFVPLSFTQDWFLPERYTQEGRSYFQWLMLVGPFVAGNAALSGFYVGRGKVKLLTSIVITSNVINVVLDLLFVFGYGKIPEMGTAGAAYATAIAQIFQFLVLFAVFLSGSNRHTYGTSDFIFKAKSFLRAFKVGAPSATGHMIEIAAWSMQFHLVALVSDTHVAVLAIGQTIFGLVAFTTEGLRGGVVACASNLVGAKYTTKATKTFLSAAKLHLLIGLVFVLPLLIYPEWLINDFLKTQEGQVDYDVLLTYTKLACWYIMAYYVVDGFVWVAAGFLTAVEDTVFIMVVNALNAWLFGLMPMYYLVNIKGGTPDKAWLVIAFYGVINMLCFVMRYKQKYKTKIL